LQLDIFTVSIIFWIVLTVLLIWITKSIRGLEERLKNIEKLRGESDED
jgi:hypothetical protein